MNDFRFAPALLVCLTLTAISTSAKGGAVVPYQGRVLSNGANFDGMGRFKFALVSPNVVAKGTATVGGGQVTNLSVVEAGIGYEVAPSVTFTGGGGSGAAATATVNEGRVVSLSITNPGNGYTSPPTVTIAEPTVSATYWSNDGTSVNGSEPATSVTAAVSKGLFSVVLGFKMDEITTEAQHAIQIGSGFPFLRIWFSNGNNGFQRLVPDQVLAPPLTLFDDALLTGTTSIAGPIQSIGGNERQGNDFQTERSADSQVASGFNSVIGGGRDNTASGNQATVPGGQNNVAAGEYSFAAGLDAKALHNFSFVFGPLTSTGQDQFLISGFAGIGTASLDPTARLTVNGNARVYGSVTASAFNTTSDRNEKQDFAPIDRRAILHQVAGIPISTWTFKSDAATRHIGPMAQDFHGAFQVGPDDKHISTVDADGVALAAIQGLYEIVREKEAELAEMRARLVKLEGQLEAKEKSDRP